MRVNYITPARKRHNARLRRPRIAPAPQPAPSPSLLPGFIPRTPRPFNAQRAESADPLPTPRSPSAPSPSSPSSPSGKRGGEARIGRNGLREPRFLPVHQGVKLGKPASPPRAVPQAGKQPPKMRKNERPRFSFARPVRDSEGSAYLHRLSAPPPRSDAERAPHADSFSAETAPRVSGRAGELPAAIDVEQLLRMDLTGVQSARKRRLATKR